MVCLKNEIWMEKFYFKSCILLTLDFKKLVSDLFHAGSSLLGNESIKRKIRIYQEINKAIRITQSITTTPKPFHMCYMYTLQRIGLTLHCKYPAENLHDQCKLISEEIKKTTESTKL